MLTYSWTGLFITHHQYQFKRMHEITFETHQ